jgi:putative endonuclease
MINQRRRVGDQGEKLAADYLISQGFTLITTNYQTRMGEIDLIVERDEVLAFVEVKTRNKVYFPISQVITPSKQRKLTLTAKHYMVNNGVRDRVCRFDVVLIDATDNYEITHIPNAFTGR